MEFSINTIEDENSEQLESNEKSIKMENKKKTKIREEILENVPKFFYAIFLK
jgi:hypothetical protein